jgi:antitoxin component of MazEF toxin-antitoxin module
MENLIDSKKFRLYISPNGGSFGITFPKNFRKQLDETQLKITDRRNPVDVFITDDSIIIKKAMVLKHKTIDERFENYDGGYIMDEEIDFGKSVGEEVW